MRYILHPSTSSSIAMPFFPGAHNFSIHNGQMNDIAGDYNDNKKTTETNMSNSNNLYVGLSVRKGNTETHTMTIGMYRHQYS